MEDKWPRSAGALIQAPREAACLFSALPLPGASERGPSYRMTDKPAKPLTLTLNKEFRHAYYQGKSCATPCFILYMVRGRPGVRRYGITTSKKLGGAVQRNRARRVIRAAVWSLGDELPAGRDFVFVARERILTAKSTEVAAMLRRALKKLQRPASPDGKRNPPRRGKGREEHG